MSRCELNAHMKTLGGSHFGLYIFVQEFLDPLTLNGKKQQKRKGIIRKVRYY